MSVLLSYLYYVKQPLMIILITQGYKVATLHYTLGAAKNPNFGKKLQC